MELEKNLKKIEEIVVNLENPNLSIDEGVKMYEEGVAIAKKALEELNAVKGKITIIKKELEAYKEESLD